MFVFYNTSLTMTGNDPGAYSKPTAVIGILLTFGGQLMNANIFGTIFDIFQKIN